MFLLSLAARAQSPKVTLVDIEGPIGPATADYLVRVIDHAGHENVQCVIVRLDTPGGLLDSTKRIVQTFYTSKVPVVVYVAPSGANAASAGCFITLAADIAAMAPNTSIGAAHPVELGGMGAEKTDETMSKKIENYSVSYMEAIADKRHRNVEWAKSSVRDSASITAEKALELKVIDLIARDVPDLLAQLDGRTVNDRTLRTRSAELNTNPMIPRERLFQMLSRPEVLFILMLVAIYGIIGELSNPGAILPGVAGGIALVLVLYMSAIVPINIAGVALILLALGFFLADVFAPSHGVLTAGGIISFMLGAMLLFERAGPAFRLSFFMILPGTLITAAFFLFVVGAGLRAQRLPVRTGGLTMLGKTVPAFRPIDATSGKVFVEGEYWEARSDTPVPEGADVEIVAIHGLTLQVKAGRKETL